MSVKTALLAGFVTVAASTGADAALINLDTLSGWDVQDQNGVLGNFYDNTYTTTAGTQVKVTDLYVWGDEYEYYINGAPIAPILAPQPPAAYNPDPTSAYNSGLFAHATFYLAAGSILSFQEITIPSGYSDGTIAVEAGSVPEPASWALLVAGFGLVGAAVRRRTAVAA